MKIVFLDIDGVLNNCVSAGVFHNNSTDINCINILNRVVGEVDCKIVIISSWKDVYDISVVKKLLLQRGVNDVIIGGTEKDIPKEKGISNFLENNEVDKFVIIDDNLSFLNFNYYPFYVKTNSFTGLVDSDYKKIIDILK